MPRLGSAMRKIAGLVGFRGPITPYVLPILFAALAATFLPISSAQAQRVALSNSEALYPRVLRVSHNADGDKNGLIVASVTSFPGGRGEEQIYASANGGISFSRRGTVSDADFSKGLCCGTLYELPSAVGAMPAGTLLWAGSIGGDTPTQPMAIKIYRSDDLGQTWSYLSNCATGAVNRAAGGLWEPEFTIAANGDLVCYYSDETVPGFSQLLQQVHSSDGIHWSAPTRIVASGVSADRPGMPVVTRLPSGRYFMTHELCGPAACTVFSKTSPDGLDWGAASDVGTRVETADGQWFLHTPTNAWAPVPGTPNGRIFVIGQILSGASGVQPGNGATMFYSDSADGSGPWKTLPAPVTIQSPPTTSNFCQNYSPPLLPSADGRTMLGLASDFDRSGGANVCKTYFAIGYTTARTSIGLTAPNLSLSGSAARTSQITIAPGAGYRGTLNLSVSIPGFNGTATIAPTALSFTADGAQTATLTITPAQTAALAGTPLLAGVGGAGLLFFGLIGRRRRAATALGIAALGLAACSGGSGGSPAPQPTPTASPTPAPATYTATLTATDANDPSITAQQTFTVTLQ